MNELVSAVIPTYNYAHFLCAAIDSVLAQTYKNIEVIVVDDGSSDNTSEVVKKYEGKITYIYQKNQGLSAARNTGIRAAHGTYVAFLDADDIWLVDKITEQMRLFESGNNVGAVSCRFYEVDESLRVLGESRHKDYPPAELKKRLMAKNVVSGGSSVVVKKACFDAVGLFDESLRSAEDWDMWLRIERKYIIRLVEKPLLKVRVGSYSMSSAGNAQKMLDNEMVVLDKYFGRGYSILKGQSLSRRYAAAAWAFSVQGQHKEALRCLFVTFWFYPLALFQKDKLGVVLTVIRNGLFFKDQKRSGALAQ